MLHVFLDPPPRPCTKMKSIIGSEGKCKGLKPRGPLESPIPSSTTLVTLLKLLEPHPAEPYRDKGLPVDNEKLVSLRRELLKDYETIIRGQERTRARLLTILSGIFSRMSPERA